MTGPAQAFRALREKIKPEWKAAFAICFLAGLLTHMPALLSDIPNHDGLSSMYFDQNMVTSGRWFLTVACGISSYYTLPWVTGVLGLLYVSIAAAALCELLEVRAVWAAGLCGALLAVFPTTASMFAYVYTMDGYMMALLLAVLAVLWVKKRRFGFLPGALCLAFSMGIYQAYLPFAMILSIFAVWQGMVVEASGESEMLSRWACFRGRMLSSMRYLYMGVSGMLAYYVILQVMLGIQGKQLADYQGIGGMASGAAAEGVLPALRNAYVDFLAFSLKGRVLFQNIFSLAAWLALAVPACAAACLLFRKYRKNPETLAVILLSAAVLPVLTNVVLLVSPSVNYHLLMRYQWVLYAVGAVALACGRSGRGKAGVWMEWVALAAASVLIFCYCVTDNIAYSNLQKRYEKTYAYCVRLLDRIEQTEGYYPGIPIAMVGVVGAEQFPVTDLTLPVTANMIGMNGDSLLYTGANYQAFIRNYLGATLNILPAEAMQEMYYSEEYVGMDSFPGADSIRIIGGIMYIKTENAADRKAQAR